MGKSDYDALNRLTGIVRPLGNTTTYEYDEEGNTVYAEGWGFSRTDTWDLLGRVTEIEFDFGPFNKSVAYEYDEVGNRVTMTDGEGDDTTYAWDALDRLASMVAPGNLWWNFTYDASSERTNLTYPNGIYTATAYDDADRITLVESRASDHTVLEAPRRPAGPLPYDD